MGGIANFTYLSGNLDANEVFATDTGTGNTLIDAYVKLYFDLPYDDNAKIASLGTVNSNLLKALKNNDFFKKSFPKTTGPELFNLAYLTKFYLPLFLKKLKNHRKPPTVLLHHQLRNVFDENLKA